MPTLIALKDRPIRLSRLNTQGTHNKQLLQTLLQTLHNSNLGLLAMASLEIAALQEQPNHVEYISIALEYHDSALKSFRPELENITVDKQSSDARLFDAHDGSKPGFSPPYQVSR